MGKGTSIFFLQNMNLSGTIKNVECKSILTLGEGDLKMIMNTNNKKVKLYGLINT